MTSISRRNGPPKLGQDRVLCYNSKQASRSTVRRHYAAWRKDQSIPPRCDIEKCQFHLGQLTWNDGRLPLILDHINGNNKDNNPRNLRYVCPNCDSQLSTRGGANRGRVHEAVEGGYTLLSRDGTRHLHLIPETACLRIIGHAPTITIYQAKATE